MAEDIDELKKLSPKERIKRLKELQEKDKEEIEEAQKLLKQAEEEAEIEEELKDIPIPQLKAVDIDELFSPAEKELFKAKRFVTEKPKKEAEEKKEKPGELESIAETAPKLTPAEEQQQIEYLNQLSRRPTEELYSRAGTLYNQFKEQGNQFTPEQQEEFGNIEYANRKKMQDIEAGNYPEGQLSKEVAREMVLIEKFKHGMYKR
ncbi:hypothetical protein KY332_01770 [Candidatus Woesearchaeota archaeon]|nr:hypothetical protein [Candidatus Woesearchaeota archaeon]